MKQNNLMVVDGSCLISILVYGSLSDFNKAAKLDTDEINSIVEQCFRHGHGHITENVGQAVSKVLSFCKTFNCDHAVVVFDKSSSTTFRKEMFPAYKAQRGSKPDAIKDQICVCKCVFNKIGISAFWSDKYEADDLAGSIIEKFKNDFDNVYYFSKDRDWFQLISGNVKGLVQYNTEEEAKAYRELYDSECINNELDIDTPTAKGKLLCVNKDIALDLMGVFPFQIPDYKGLAGDTSDNIPGVPGVGDKTAIALLSVFGNVEGVYKALDTLTEDAFKSRVKHLIKKCPYKALVDGKKDAFMCKDLATIRTKIPISFTKDRLQINLNKANMLAAVEIYNLEDDLTYYLC